MTGVAELTEALEAAEYEAFCHLHRLGVLSGGRELKEQYLRLMAVTTKVLPLSFFTRPGELTGDRIAAAFWVRDYLCFDQYKADKVGDLL